jgi:hypothetical protein
MLARRTGLTAHIGTLLGFFLTVSLAGAVAHAQDTGAISSGNWNDPSVWTTDSVPGSSNSVYIGSNTPPGAAPIATITLTADESADDLYLGALLLDNGTLDLGGNTLTISNDLVIGMGGGSGTINEGGGSFTAASMTLNGNSFTFGASDQVASLAVVGANATTTAAGNVTGGVSVLSGSTLNLGANLSVIGTLDVENTGSVLNMNGNNISANTINLGSNFLQAVTLNRGTSPGSLTASSLYVDGNFNLLPTDAITNFYISQGTTTLNSGVAVSGLTLNYSSTGTTTTAANVAGDVRVLNSSTLNLGANLSLSGILDVENTGSVLNMNDNNISASTIYLGWNNNETVTLNRGTLGGSLTATSLYVYGGATVSNPGTFDLLPSDSITNFYLDDAGSTLNSGVAVSNLTLENGSSVGTTTSTNVTGNVSVFSGPTLDQGSAFYLGANLNLSGTLDVENTHSALFLESYNATANTIYLGWNDQQTVTVNYGGPGNTSTLTANNLYVYGGGNTFDLSPGDSITNFYLGNANTTLSSGVAVSSLTLENGSTASTTTTGNVTGYASVLSGSTLTLGANLSLSGNLDVEGAGSTLNGQGFNISANQFTAGYSTAGAVSVSRVGLLNLNQLDIGNGSTMTITGGVVNDLISLTGGSVLTVDQTGGTGLTLDGLSAGDLTIDPSSMDLIFSSTGWDFRWQDPTGGGNWISTLDAMIASGQIVIPAPTSYSVFDQNGFTYIADGAVPEPASTALICIACIGLSLTRQRPRTGQS